MRSQEQETKILKETTILVKLFLKYNMSDEMLAKGTKLSSSTIQRRLTNKEDIIKIYDNCTLDGFVNNTNLSYGEYIYELVQQRRKQNLQNAKINGGKSYKENNMAIKDDNGKFIGSKPIMDLKVFYNNSKKTEQENLKQQYVFLLHIMLKFGLRYQSLSEITGIDIETLKHYMDLYNFNYENSMTLVDRAYFYSNQKQAQENVLKYYEKFKEFKKTNNTAGVKLLIHQIDDSEYMAMKSKYINSKNYEKKVSRVYLKDEDVLIALKFQLKYCLPTLAVATDLGINRSTLGRKYYELFEKEDEFGNKIKEYEILKSRYLDLSNFYQKSIFKNSGRKW